MKAASTLIALIAAWTAARAAAESEPTSRAQAERLFAVEVFSLLEAKCFGCHGGDAQDIKGGFDLRSRRTAFQGGESGVAALVAGDPEGSPLYLAIRWDGLEMPPKESDRLTPAQIEAVRRWISGGAPWPDATRRKQLASNWSVACGIPVPTSGGLSEEWTNRLYRPEDLWAYQPLVQPEVPWSHAGGSGNAVDAFVNRKLADAGIEPAPRADKRTLIRRVAYDLTGLPPTPEEIADFLADESHTAFCDLVERLLASPRYGEQWGKHWLDVVRYADTSGFSNDYVRPNAWRYRDYVIRAFNADKPYDEFIREQIAGDELDPTDVENLIAVGFLRMGPWEHTSMSVATVTRQQFLDDITNHVGEVFLGHALRCASCHDHKFDPIPTRDYYRLQAVFAPVQFADREAAFLPVEKTMGFEDGRRRVETLLAAGGVRSLATIPKAEWPVDSFDADTEVKGHAKVNNKRKEALTRELNRYQPLAFSVYSGPPRVYVSNKPLHPMPPPDQLQGAVEDVHILRGGALEAPEETVSPGVLSVAVGPYAGDDLRRPVEDARAREETRALGSIPSEMHGRRIALAEWIASPDNPLTARVMVNRIWQYHFSKALAGNPNNFGQTGRKPTHPELLDFLAAYFIEHGWSVKAMHRLIVFSDAYQRSGRHPQPGPLRQQDPDNDWLAVFSPRRLSAEELRDSMLFVSGELNLEMGGVPVRPEINREVAMQPRHIMGSVAPAYQPMRTPAERHRRTIYAERIRTLRDPMLEVFNQPGLDASCERRDSSATTPQVFSQFNSQNSHDRAIAMACRLQREAETCEAQITAAFQIALGRSPAAQELAESVEHVDRLVAHHRLHPPERDLPPTYVVRQMVEEMTGLKFYWVEDLDVYQDYVPDAKAWDVDAKTQALADLCLVLFNSNEFIYVY
jgi:mono/diheme cytochrome c family protein